MRSVEERARLQRQIVAKLRSKPRAHVSVQPPPRYDEIFYEGLAWLDGLAHDQPLIDR